MRVLIVDDEPLARRGLRRELERLPGVESIGESAGRDDAIGAIEKQRPDVVLLDVRLGNATAFEIIERIGVDRMPLVIFVTAYDRHALKAFEVHAVDYVLKPVDPDRLRDAIERASRLRTLEQGASLAERLERLLAAQSAGAPAPGQPAATADRIAVHDGTHSSFVEVGAIDWFEAHGNQVRVHVGARVHLLRSTLARIADRVGTESAGQPGFVRVRRSALVNVRAILSVERYGKGMFLLTLRGGTKVISSRYHQNELRRLLRLEVR